MVGDQGGEGGVVLQETLSIFINDYHNCHKFIIHLDFVARFVSDNNVVGDPLRMETLWHPRKKIYILPLWGPIPPKQFIKVKLGLC